MNALSENYSVSGRFLRTAKIRGEWTKTVSNPEIHIAELSDNNSNIDLFTFRQTLPDIRPKFNYFMELNQVAAIPVSTFNNWYNNQINAGARKSIKKAKKKGVTTKIVEYSDDLVYQVMNIFNETPIRQGRPYAHYGKDFKTVKQELSKDLQNRYFIGAFYKDCLIGFIQLANAGHFAVPFGMVSLISHRDKSPQNALIAEAVIICSDNSISYLVYGEWTFGSINDFKRYNGCERIDLPRYYIPLSLKGKIALKLRLHRGFLGFLPNFLLLLLSRLRNFWYVKKFRNDSRGLN